MGPALRRYLALALALVLAGGLAGAAWALWRPAQAEVSVLVNPTEGNPYNPSESGQELVNLETEAQLVPSDQVAAQVAERLGSSLTPQQLLNSLAVSVSPNSQILIIRYTAEDQAVAAAHAQAFAEGYLEYRQSRSSDLLSTQRAGLTRQLDRRSDDLQELIEQRSQASPASAEATVLQRAIRATSLQISDLQVRLAELDRGPADPGQVVRSPQDDPGQSMLASPPSAAGVGALVGFGIFVLVAAAAILRKRGESTAVDLPRTREQTHQPLGAE